MGRLTLPQAQSIPDAYMTHDWNVIFTSIPGFVGTDPRQLSFRAQTSEVPGMTVEPVVVSLKDVEVNFPLRQTWSKTIQMTFLEVRDMSTRRTFLNWMKFARNMKTGAGSYKSQLVVDIMMELYDSTDTVISLIKLESAFPSEVGALALNSPGEPGYLPVTFTYDSVSEDGS